MTVDDKLTGADTMKCAGVGGYSLHVTEDDERSAISVVAPDEQVFPLDDWKVSTPGFSTLGKKAEWRVKKVAGKSVPVALIVRMNVADPNVTDQSDVDQPKRGPLLAVAQIREGKVCLVAKVNAALSNANAQARIAADSEGQACLASDTTVQQTN